jgi:2-oxo-4-hydroxy-4-carboxy-5-ureidoimidazoline decarboxylase
MTITLAALNTCPATDFVRTLADIFEHSPWVAEQVVALRPFVDVAALHAAMVAAVAAAGAQQQLDLLCAHPDLAGKLARAGVLTEASTREQAGAGLDRLTDSEYVRFEAVNTRYREKFGIPFIIAVKGHNKHSILASFEQRVDNDRDNEFATALAQVALIADFRLQALIVG